VQQRGQSLARLVEPSDEPDRPVLSAPLRARLGGLEEADVDPVRDDDRIPAQVLDEGAPGILDTAIRALTFSRADCRMGYAAVIARDRGLDVWKVATIGPSAAQQASTDRLGVTGSCTCSTSKPPSRSHRRTRAADRNPKLTLATEPL
jgi:hypothetical protein